MPQPAWCVALVRVQGASRAQAGPCIVEKGRGKWLMEAARLCSQFSDDRRQTPEEQCWGWGHIAPSGNPAPVPQTSEPGPQIIFFAVMRYSNSRGLFLVGVRRRCGQKGRRATLRGLCLTATGGGGSIAGEQLLAGSGYPNLPCHSGSPLFCPHSSLNFPWTRQEVICFPLLPFHSMVAGGAPHSALPPLPTHLPLPVQPMGVGVWLSPGKRIISSVMYMQTGALLLGRTRQGEGAHTAGRRGFITRLLILNLSPPRTGVLMAPELTAPQKSICHAALLSLLSSHSFPSPSPGKALTLSPASADAGSSRRAIWFQMCGPGPVGSCHW